jgi:hypothetical protein
MRTFFLKRPQAGQPIPNGFAQWCLDVDKALANINVHLGAVSWNQGVPTILTRGECFEGYGGSGTPGFPWGNNYTFGITQTASDKLKVWKGKFRRWGDQTYNAADTEVTFTGDGDQYIVWKWSADGGLVIESTPQTNYPSESDSTYIYGAVHKVNLAGSTFTLLESIQTGIINAPIFTVPGA